MNPKRVRTLKEGTPAVGTVVYWMSRDQRSVDNWALIHAQNQAILRKCPLRVVFCLLPDFLSATPQHYHFMLEGLKSVAIDLLSKNIPFVMLSGEPEDVLPRYIHENRIALLVTDFDPLRVKQAWKKKILKQTNVRIEEVDAHNIIPCWEASPRQEFGAYTLRPKIHRQLHEYIEPFSLIVRHPYSETATAPIPDGLTVLDQLSDEKTSSAAYKNPSGQVAAMDRLAHFIENGLEQYDNKRNDPSLDGQSNLSPYLHFGQLSAQRILLTIAESNVIRSAQDVYLEELVVRRELADNFCYYNTNYDNIKGFPAWAQETLEKHWRDERPYLYDKEELEKGLTHDPAWNAAQQQLVTSGKMHGYMRMYWAKKILEWTSDPETAMKTAIFLNDRYSLDGRDPNGYTGIAWSIGGVHDRAWGERTIFGKIRYMNFAGLKRKFNIASYIQQHGAAVNGASAQPW